MLKIGSKMEEKKEEEKKLICLQYTTRGFVNDVNNQNLIRLGGTDLVIWELLSKPQKVIIRKNKYLKKPDYEQTSAIVWEKNRADRIGWVLFHDPITSGHHAYRYDFNRQFFTGLMFPLQLKWMGMFDEYIVCTQCISFLIFLFQYDYCIQDFVILKVLNVEERIPFSRMAVSPNAQYMVGYVPEKLFVRVWQMDNNTNQIRFHDIFLAPDCKRYNLDKLIVSNEGYIAIECGYIGVRVYSIHTGNCVGYFSTTKRSFIMESCFA
jgi:hypothetical protein